MQGPSESSLPQASKGARRSTGPVLEAVGLSRSYGPIEVLSDVSLSVRAGEVHAIVGENGAGKSTLMKILSGHLTSTRGSMTLDGAPIELKGPVDAERRGIVLVHQEIMLAPDLTIAENMFLGREVWRGLTSGRQGNEPPGVRGDACLRRRRAGDGTRRAALHRAAPAGADRPGAWRFRTGSPSSTNRPLH